LFLWDFRRRRKWYGARSHAHLAHSGDYTVTLTVIDKGGARGTKGAGLMVDAGTIVTPRTVYGAGLTTRWRAPRGHRP